MDTMTTEDQTYNGWKNYPTWNVALWLSNDEPLFTEACRQVENAMQEARLDDRVIDGNFSVEEVTRWEVAETIKNFVVDDLAPDLGASFAADLLGFALDQVDWFEIADNYIGTVAELNES